MPLSIVHSLQKADPRKHQKQSFCDQGWHPTSTVPPRGPACQSREQTAVNMAEQVERRFEAAVNVVKSMPKQGWCSFFSPLVCCNQYVFLFRNTQRPSISNLSGSFQPSYESMLKVSVVVWVLLCFPHWSIQLSSGFPNSKCSFSLMQRQEITSHFETYHLQV